MRKVIQLWNIYVKYEDEMLLNALVEVISALKYYDGSNISYCRNERNDGSTWQF